MALSNQVRIIAGQWRGRKISFPDSVGLRPTGDRIRETVFNWLQTSIVGSRCLDLFAGSGVLGFEALSRGAKEVLFVESNATVATHLQQVILHLDARAQVLRVDASAYCQTTPEHPYNIVFLDPPFGQQLLNKICQGLNHPHWLAPNALIYLEYEASLVLDLPGEWVCLKSKSHGATGYGLWQRP